MTEPSVETTTAAGAAAPPWFRRALASLPEHSDVAVDGVRIHYRAWGDPARPGLVLLHGGAAHSGWWDHVAPLLSSHRVVAPDLSGHGDSGRREVYDMHAWAREVRAVAAAENLDRPVVVGHSMGGWVAVTTGVEHGDAVAAVAYIDSPLNDQPPEESRLEERRRPRRVYPTAEDAMARFRTLPPQEVVLPYVREHVARESLHRVEGGRTAGGRAGWTEDGQAGWTEDGRPGWTEDGRPGWTEDGRAGWTEDGRAGWTEDGRAGWTWKFDPRFFGRRLLLRDLLPQLRCPVALFRCEHGIVSPQMVAEMRRLVPHYLPVVELPDAGHHPMLDQPLALVTGLRTLLALWPAAAPA